MKYLSRSEKSKKVAAIIEDAVKILTSVGIPVDDRTERNLDRMAMAFLAVAGVTKQWTDAEGYEEKRFLKTRDIIRFTNANFEENISSGSYDDIRRKDLKPLILAGLIVNSAEKPDAATNDPTRAYTLETEFKNLIKSYKTPSWKNNLKYYLKGRVSLTEQLARKRNMKKVAVTLPDGKQLKLSTGQHNLLQKLVIEDFLPRYGRNSQILYVGDTSEKMLHVDEKKLKELNFFELAHEELPDIVAYNAQKNWLYLIEAVHSSGSISEMRMLELKKLTRKCRADIIFVTAFMNRTAFRKWVSEIAWETEVWIADNPDHLIHFDGEKFLGPYSENR